LGITDEQGSPFANVFADIADSVIPSVVAVIPTKVDTVTFHRNPFSQFFDEHFGDRNPFNDFFDDGGGSGGSEPRVEPRERRQQGLGSGVVVSPDGYILTNYHVVAGADEIEVSLADERVLSASFVGGDSLSDVAVIKINETVSDLPVAYLGDSHTLRPGDWVIAVGNPFSLTSSVTVGIISALGRSVAGQGTFQNFIQTDAAINPGNSGGALVNIRGELIGINTMIYTRSGGYMGIGFAIPINMARRIMEDLIYYGEVIRGWIGVSVQDLNEAMRGALGFARRTGVLVAEVYEGQPADKAGVQRGDIVLSIGKTSIRSVNELRNAIAALRPGDMVPVRVLRDGKEKELWIEAGQRSEQKTKGLAKHRHSGAANRRRRAKVETATAAGITVADITKALRAEYDIPSEVRGVVVLDLSSSFSDARRGLERGDVISEARVSGGTHAVDDADSYDRAFRGIEPGDAVLLLVHRGARTLFVGFRLRPQ